VFLEIPQQWRTSVLRNPKIGIALRTHRENKRLTQADVAVAKHWSTTFVSMLDNGYVPPCLDTILEYARLVELDTTGIWRELRAMLPQLRAVRHRIADDVEASLESLPSQDTDQRTEVCHTA
jgi:transcriptional regulator with XRE-family HTH domain